MLEVRRYISHTYYLKDVFSEMRNKHTIYLLQHTDQCKTGAYFLTSTMTRGRFPCPDHAETICNKELPTAELTKCPTASQLLITDIQD